MKQAHSLKTLIGVTALGVILMVLGFGMKQTPAVAQYDGIPVVTPGMPAAVSGYLWSDMPDGSDQVKSSGNTSGGRGLGWISMNSNDIDTTTGSAVSPTIPYGVTFNSGTGKFAGNAWSEYGGWLEFAPTAGFPDVANNQLKSGASISTICLNSPSPQCVVRGWARFTAGKANNGGWDGWVSMGGDGVVLLPNGVMHPYGVVFDKATQTFSGYAWGGTVAGWINFDKVKLGGPTNTNICINTTTNAVVQYTGTVFPNECKLICYNELVTPRVEYRYIESEGVPSQCTKKVCTDYNDSSIKHEYPVDEEEPLECSGGGDDDRYCPSDGTVLFKDVEANGPVQHPPGSNVWWGIVGGYCRRDACLDSLFPEQPGFQAIPPYKNNTSCTESVNPPTGAPINPQYREN